MRHRLDWFIREPTTGRVVLAQAPNPPLAVWALASVVRLAFHPAGTAGTVVGVIATGALAFWAALEILQGASPFRRTLGGIVLAGLVFGLLHG